MNTTTLEYWKAEARRRQAKAKAQRRPRGRSSFVIFARDLPGLHRRLGRRLSAMLTVEELPHIMDVDECGRF